MSTKVIPIWVIRIKAWYWKLFNKIFPLRLLIIKCNCMLRSDCTIPINVMMLTPKNDFDLNAILDCLFKAAGQHFEEYHRIGRNQFIGLQLKTKDTKYTIYLGDVKHE